MMISTLFEVMLAASERRLLMSISGWPWFGLRDRANSRFPNPQAPVRRSGFATIVLASGKARRS